MNYRNLGKTGLSVSEIAFGCGPTGGGLLSGTSRDQEKLVGYALECGINIFDTAAIYGQGKSEENLGKALHKLKATPIIASKVALELPDLTNIKQSVINSVEASLKRLRVDSIDLIQLHNRVGFRRAEKSNIGVGAQLTLADVMDEQGVTEAFSTLRKQGKIKATGFTGFGGAATEITKLIESNQFDSINVLFNLLNRSSMASSLASHSADDSENNDFEGIGLCASENGMGVLSIRVLAAGNLINFQQTKGSELTKFKKIKLQQALKRAGFNTGPELAMLAIRFAFSCPEIASLVIGFSDSTQIQAAVMAGREGKFSEYEYISLLNSDI